MKSFGSHGGQLSYNIFRDILVQAKSKSLSIHLSNMTDQIDNAPKYTIILSTIPVDKLVESSGENAPNTADCVTPLRLIII
ncbi:conserved hypothetical protein [Teredinibacter turnerae T7901]|uniref:Uncharacterized protein n=1 Tax=Teredinibacter turnerae (strain ATCC 39867 / T7901) TaxID=377629 RepID=C5BJC3_TERTT|nr:conserved hypothetical protein [Teredinibacter turnerae T7901]